MGWLWWSSRDATDTTSNSGSLETAVDHQQSSTLLARHSAPPNNGTREEKADAELESFLRSFSAPSTSIPAASQECPTEPESVPPTNHERLNLDGTPNIHPYALYPSTLSCRQAFDQAMYCQSPGGKFNDIYRFGSVQDCSEQWGAFWFCMRTRTLPAEDRAKQTKDFYAARDERRKKERGSSEDVWEIREKPVERAFWKDPNAEDDDGRGVQIRE